MFIIFPAPILPDIRTGILNHIHHVDGSSDWESTFSWIRSRTSITRTPATSKASKTNTTIRVVWEWGREIAGECRVAVGVETGILVVIGVTVSGDLPFIEKTKRAMA